MKIKIFIFLAILFSSFAEAPSGFASLVEQADTAYSHKQYAEAVKLYQTVISSEGTDAQLYYNLGNTYYQMGDYGNAMLSWLRGRKISPSNKEINANIRYLQSKVEDSNKAEQKGKRYKTSPDEDAFFQSIHTVIAKDTSSNVWAVWAAACFLLFIAALASYIFSRNVPVRKTGFFGGIICMAAVIIFICFAFMAAKQQNSSDAGVVMAYKVALMTEPGKEVDPLKAMTLTKGTVVQILSEEIDAEGKVTWYKVRLNSDYIGWVSASDIEIVGAV